MCKCRRSSTHVFGGMNQDLNIIQRLHRKKRLPTKFHKGEGVECYVIKINGAEKQFHGPKILVWYPENTNIEKVAKISSPQAPRHTEIIKSQNLAKNMAKFSRHSKMEIRLCSDSNHRTNCLRTYARRKKVRKTSSQNIKLLSQIMAAQIEKSVEEHENFLNSL